MRMTSHHRLHVQASHCRNDLRHGLLLFFFLLWERCRAVDASERSEDCKEKLYIYIETAASV